MSTELATTGSAAITNVGPIPLAPLQVVATSVEEMNRARGGLEDWFRNRLRQAEADLKDAENNLQTARVNGFRSDSFQRAATKARKFVEYYEKVLAAVAAGYLIIPDLPVDIFAIRTTRSLPKPEKHRSTWEDHVSDFPQASNRPMLGDGEYVDRFPVKEVTRETYEEKNETKTRFVGEPVAFAEVEFPIALATPAVMDATRAAMARNIFDEIGGLPSRRTRSKGDPIVVGRILRPGEQGGGLFGAGVTFLIAWWVDTRQL